MITVGVIRNGSSYLTQHLRKNDYWAEGEKAVAGEWIGLGAARLGLEGRVEDEPFEALRQNRHPRTGRLLTARARPDRVAFFDVQLSAPKDVSVLALLGDDPRVRDAFVAAARTALGEMERFAAVRERRGDAADTEKFRLTGNFVGALFVHDTSRDLDPQLHAHVVLANATWDATRQRWLALQPAEMLRASVYVRQVFYRELAGGLRALGYEPHGMTSKGFAVEGVEHLRERFSKRARRVKALADAFAVEHGRRPTPREVEVLVRESRRDKLTEIATPAVRARQRAELSDDEARALRRLVQQARSRAAREQWSHGLSSTVLEAAVRHVFERSSAAREGTVLAAALELHPHFYRWRELRDTLARHPDVVRREGEMTLRLIRREEADVVQRVREGRNQRFPLGAPTSLPARLTAGQRQAATAVLASRDFVSVLLGDAGTGKTTVLAEIEHAHRAAGGARFVGLAPTTRARDELRGGGFENADTVQRFLVGETLQQAAAGRVILVDEAGLLSTQQLDQLTRAAQAVRARLLLVGDTKQHYSVRRGDALRNVIKHSGTPVIRLAEVLRQRREADRRFSRMLARGEVTAAFDWATEQGMVREAPDDSSLFVQAATHYVENRVKGVPTLVVIPFWEEIERFNAAVRPALRQAGLLGDAEVTREAVKPLTWTEEQKTHWEQYAVGDRLLFARDTRFFKKGTAAEVIDVLPDGLRVRGPRGRVAKISRRQRSTYEVGRPQQLAVAAGDRLLIRGRHDGARFTNGEFREVAHVDPAANRIVLSDGRELPPDFAAWTYGHALTSYRAQGSTAEESLLVLGDVANRALARRQFYVGSTRYRGTHAIYVSDRAAILHRLAQEDPGRELATEFLARHRLVLDEHETPRRERGWRERMGTLWRHAAVRLRHARKRQTAQRKAN